MTTTTTNNIIALSKALDKAERAYQRYEAKGTRPLLLLWFRAEVAELPIAEQAGYEAFAEEVFMDNTQRFEAKARAMYASRNATIKKEATLRLA